jgi:hypothetical protein
MKYEVTPILGTDMSRHLPFIMEARDEADLVDILTGHREPLDITDWYYEWHEVTH